MNDSYLLIDLKELLELLKKMRPYEKMVLNWDRNNNELVRIRHYIKNDVHEFSCSEEDLRSGQWCPICQSEKTQKQLDFEQKVYKEVRSEYTVIGAYQTMRKKVKLVHSNGTCNYIWDCDMRNFFYNKTRCPKCANRIPFTKEDFIKELGNDFELITDYHTLNTDVYLRHNSEKCGHYEWYIRPRSFLANKSCPECTRIKREIDFIRLVRKLTGTEYSVIGSYKNRAENIKMRHNSTKCNNHEWDVKPNNFIFNGSRCPICARHENEKSSQKKEHITQHRENIYEEPHDKLADSEHSIVRDYTDKETYAKMRYNSFQCKVSS